MIHDRDPRTPWGPLQAMRGRRPPFGPAAAAPWTPAYARVVRRRCWAALALASVAFAALLWSFLQ